ncbi:MAG: hypothetical protein SOY59_05645 [Ligilactobacillus agilis]|nr:hypothetical protein [Ligilactobacillus agilis]
MKIDTGVRVMTNEEKLNKQLRITMLALGRIQGETFFGEGRESERLLSLR